VLFMLIAWQRAMAPRKGADSESGADTVSLERCLEMDLSVTAEKLTLILLDSLSNQAAQNPMLTVQFARLAADLVSFASRSDLTLNAAISLLYSVVQHVPNGELEGENLETVVQAPFFEDCPADVTLSLDTLGINRTLLLDVLASKVHARLRMVHWPLLTSLRRRFACG
jgi:hypothetical protein